MAANRLNPVAVGVAGQNAAPAVAGAGAGQLNVADTYSVNNNGKVIFIAKKTGAGACTVTIITPGTVDGLAIADRTINVPATTGDVRFGGYDPATYNAPGTNDLQFTLSEITGLTIEVLRLP